MVIWADSNSLINLLKRSVQFTQFWTSDVDMWPLNFLTCKDLMYYSSNEIAVYNHIVNFLSQKIPCIIDTEIISLFFCAFRIPLFQWNLRIVRGCTNMYLNTYLKIKSAPSALIFQFFPNRQIFFILQSMIMTTP